MSQFTNKTPAFQHNLSMFLLPQAPRSHALLHHGSSGAGWDVDDIGWQLFWEQEAQSNVQVHTAHVVNQHTAKCIG